MLLTPLGFEPCDPPMLRRAGDWCVYALALPLLGDGRLAAFRLAAGEPRDARVCRLGDDGSRVDGHVLIADGQFCFCWDGEHPAAPPLVRFFGRRFLPGDPVCLRSSTSAMALFTVCSAQRAHALAAGAGLVR